jgi:hypothetical protein
MEEAPTSGGFGRQVSFVTLRNTDFHLGLLGGRHEKTNMEPVTHNLRPGDFVEVLSPQEILQTLDGDGTLDKLPFMPEMIEFCGRRFQVSQRVVKTCYYGTSTGMRKFPAEDVVLLEGLRCSGTAHDGCQKACTIFWREAWLRKVEGRSTIQSSVDPEGRKQLRARLKTSTGPNTYFCQASEILNSTAELSRWERFGKSFSAIQAGNCGVFEMAKLIGIWLFWRARRIVLGPYARGSHKSTPVESLNLRSGERIEIKPLSSISKSLDERAHNRGLYFTPLMGRLCGEQYQVKDKIEKIIVDGTGEMRRLRNTVFLEGSLCGCACVAFGGCPRGEFAYWREIWLRRSTSGVQPGDGPATAEEKATVTEIVSFAMTRKS